MDINGPLKQNFAIQKAVIRAEILLESNPKHINIQKYIITKILTL